MEVVLVHPVLEVADPDRPVVLGPIPAGSSRLRRRRGDRGRRREVLDELRRRGRGRGHHGVVRRRVGDDHPPRLRHVVVRVRRVRVRVRRGRRRRRGVRVGVVVRRGSRGRGVGGGRCRCHLHRRRRRRG